MIKRIMLPIAALVLIGGLAWFQYSRRIQEYRSDQFLMDTLISITVYGKNQELLRKAVVAAYAEMRRIAELADSFPQPGTAAWRSSDICRINDQAGKAPVRVDEETLAMLLLAQKYYRLSHGAFDVTVGPLMELWGFGGKNPHLPPSEQIRSALALVSSEDLIINERNHTAYLRKAAMKLDLGAIAKGYATEKAARVLVQHGIDKALIDAGGNIRVIGRNSRNSPWKIGIKDPRTSDAIVAVLPLVDTSAVTSADYYRAFEERGKRYHHILDPRTGYPATHTISATVITKDAGLADILSTVFFVLPPDESLELAATIPGVELFLVTADRRIRHSTTLLGTVEVLQGEAYRYDQKR
jgi:FAD:protein FMN transferase